ncbi:MAG: hypothetical protein FWD82_06990 [Defluviitaleaceae bacterium]|nr:hypothetical protein [Defluviitaleaceae bacterium]
MQSYIEKQKNKLEKTLTQRNKLNAHIKSLQDDIASREAQEVMKTISEIKMTPEEAKKFLRQAKKSQINEIILESNEGAMQD